MASRGQDLGARGPMSEHARRIGAKNLDERLLVENPRNEFGRLAGTFNGLLERLSYSFSQQRQFMADASHIEASSTRTQLLLAITMHTLLGFADARSTQ